jgi:hypothetical protein
VKEPAANRALRFVESYDGAFSPDGRLVAVPAITRRGRRQHVALIDLARRVARLLPGPAGAELSGGGMVIERGAVLQRRRRTARRLPSGREESDGARVEVEPFIDLAAR